MKAVVERALKHWGLVGAAFRLVAARENAVYEITRGRRRYALRLHRQGYRTNAELNSELLWMAEVSRAGISVPAPIPTPSGDVLCEIEGFQVDLLIWLTGQTMADALPALKHGQRCQLFHDLGRDMAKLHQCSDAWEEPTGFDRVRWDTEGLLGETPLWDRFWENPNLSDADRDLFAAFRARASEALLQLGPSLDYGLIHADLVPNNVLVDAGTLRFIDFDDGGFGYRLFDVATALLKHRQGPQFPDFHDSLVDGYRSVRPLDAAQLDLFLTLRAATYVGWNITRMGETGGVERNARFINTLRNLASDFV